jgi:hypothetical protein
MVMKVIRHGMTIVVEIRPRGVRLGMPVVSAGVAMLLNGGKRWRGRIEAVMIVDADRGRMIGRLMMRKMTVGEARLVVDDPVAVVIAMPVIVVDIRRSCRTRVVRVRRGRRGGFCAGRVVLGIGVGMGNVGDGMTRRNGGGDGAVV